MLTPTARNWCGHWPAVNIMTDGADVSWALHVGYGNRYARPLWEGHYDFLFPAVKDANVDQLVRAELPSPLPSSPGPTTRTTLNGDANAPAATQAAQADIPAKATAAVAGVTARPPVPS